MEIICLGNVRTYSHRGTIKVYYIAEEQRVYSNPVRLETQYFLCKTSSAYDYQPQSIKYLHYETLFKKFLGNMWYETLSFQKCT